MVHARRITIESNLDQLVREINAGEWDEANDLVAYDVESLRAYLDRQDTVLVACHDDEGDRSRLVGIASGRLEIKPYGRQRWLYIDEVDVAVDQRRKGGGVAIMQAMFAIAREAGCVEVWLGTEPDNTAANALYGSLDASEREDFVGYLWERGGF